MQTNGRTILLTIALVAQTSACDFDHDNVEPGAYGPMPAGMTATVSGTPPAQTAAGTRASTPQTAGGKGGGPEAGGASGMATPAPQADNAGTEVAVDPPPSITPNNCDLTGRWLSTVHQATDALGQLQFAHSYLYYEIEQQGDAFAIKKGLHCGDDAVGVGTFAVSVDFSGSWATAATKVSYTGRTGSSAATSGGCQFKLDKWYIVRGATLPHYTDPAIPLPDADQKASDGTPGWEDWDNDGNPGVTGLLSGTVSGKIFVAPRAWTSASETVMDVSSVFRAQLQWNQEPNVMAYDGSPLLASESARAADQKLHFVQFARLSADQAAGDDAAICQSIVELAPMLTPEAAASEM